MHLRATLSQEAGVVYLRINPSTHPKSKDLLQMLVRAREKIPEFMGVLSEILQKEGYVFEKMDVRARLIAQQVSLTEQA